MEKKAQLLEVADNGVKSLVNGKQSNQKIGIFRTCKCKKAYPN